MQTILQHLYKKKTLGEIEVETLQQLTQSHPYFAIGHYLLAKKLAPTGGNDSRDQFQKTLVYFHNPLWLRYQLSAEEKTVEDSSPQEDAQPALDISNPVNDVSLSSHDMIEEVVLHPETQYGTPEETIEVQTRSLQGPLVESTSDTVAEPAKEEPAVVNHPERFSFQAYHTVDYFASQGIRLSQEAQSSDKLGKQLKSFTEWLKTMRRLPESVAEEELDKISDVEIVQFAADSLEEEEVVTEAMAEVLEKQGKFAKAREVYQKLSLLHPHKNAYFAAKIEDLKQQ